MKLCPQCEFLYEDDQILCDMDGEGLVHDNRAEVFSGARPAVISPKPKHARLRVIIVTSVVGLLLSVLLSFAYYASSRSLDSDAVSRSRNPETNPSPQTAAASVDNSSREPAASPSQPLPDTASEPSSPSAHEPADQSESARTQTTSQIASKARDNTLNANDSRLTISKRVPPLPHLNPLPQLLPPRRLGPATTISGKQKIARQTRTETSQKSLIVEVNPATKNSTKRSKVSGFLKKTGRMLTKPFKR